MSVWARCVGVIGCIVNRQPAIPTAASLSLDSPHGVVITETTYAASPPDRWRTHPDRRCSRLLRALARRPSGTAEGPIQVRMERVHEQHPDVPADDRRVAEEGAAAIHRQ